MRFLISLLVYCFFGGIALWVDCKEIQINFLIGWVAYGISDGFRFEIVKRRKPHFKFLRHRFEVNFTNNSDETFSVYSGSLDENGNPFNLKLIDALCPQPVKSDIIRCVNMDNSGDVA
jgi:hypothetical protein